MRYLAWADPPAASGPYVRLPIAVYGTLRTGLHNHAHFLDGHEAITSVAAGVVLGFELHELPSGLPIVVPRLSSSAAVEVVTIDASPAGDELRDDLDGLEGYVPYQSTWLYDRVRTEAIVDGVAHEVWLYAAGDSVVHEGLGDHSRIASGDWTLHNEAR